MSKKLNFIIREAQISDLTQINEIYNHYVENSPSIFVDERSPISLVDHTNLLARTRQLGGVFDVAWNPNNQSEIYGFSALIVGTYRGVKLQNITVPLTFLRPEKRGMKIADALFVHSIPVQLKIPQFGGLIGEVNLCNKSMLRWGYRNRSKKDDNQESAISWTGVMLKNISFKFGEFTSMLNGFWNLDTLSKIHANATKLKPKL